MVKPGNFLMTSGNLIEIQSVGRDITALKQAEEGGHEKAKTGTGLVAENISDLVCLNDLEGRYTYVSPSCKTLLGYDPEELLGLTPYTFIHPDDHEKAFEEQHRPAATGQVAPPPHYPCP